MSRRTFRVAACLSMLLLLALPASAAKLVSYLRDLHGMEEKRRDEIAALATQEPKGKPILAAYEKFLKQLEPLPGQQQSYPPKLKKELEALSPDNRETLTRESLLAFPYAYNARLRGYAEAHLGITRVQLALGKLAEAETAASKAAQAAELALSPIAMSEIARPAHEILRQIYERRNAIGKAMLSKLNADLLVEYDSSPQGIKDYCLDKQLETDFFDAVWEIDSFIRGVNTERGNIADARMNRLLGALSAVSASVNTMAANQAAARGNSGSAMSYRFNASLADFTLAATQAKMAGQKVGLDSFLNSFAMPMLSAQLADPKMGANVPQIIKDFASDAAKADPALAGAAGEVAKGVNDIVAVRGKGNQKKTQDAVGQFAEVLTQFQAKVQEIEGHP